MYGSCDHCNKYPVALQVVTGKIGNEQTGVCQPCNDLNTKAAK